jgi:hypothetical protein
LRGKSLVIGFKESLQIEFSIPFNAVAVLGNAGLRERPFIRSLIVASHCG